MRRVIKNKLLDKDMTNGKPWVLILEFALPLMIGNVLQQVYTFVDTLIVGQVLGINTLAAIGVTEWLVFLIFASIQGVVQGFSIVMAQRFGASDYKGLRKTIYNGIYLTLIMLVVFTIIGQLIIYPILILLHTPNEIIWIAIEYLRTLFIGIPLVFIYNYLAAILRAIGNSNIPLQAMVISSIENIVLDIIFVYIWGWGIKGAAIGTVISMFTALVHCFIMLRKFKELKINSEEKKLDIKIILELLKLGIPMGFQNVITSVGGLIVQSVINGFGVIFIAGYTAANKLYGLLEIAASSYGYAMNTFVGQNKGAGKTIRLRRGLLSGIFIGIITAYCMSAIMMIFGRGILKCFVTGETEMVNQAVENGYHFLLILSIFFPCLYILYILRSWIQGMGNSTWPMISSFAQLIMRISCALILTRFIGESAVYWGEVLAWIGADSLLVFIYYSLINKYK